MVDFLKYPKLDYMQFVFSLHGQCGVVESRVKYSGE